MIGYVIFWLLLISANLIKNKRNKLVILFVTITIFSAIRYGIGYDYYSYLAESIGVKDNSSIELIPRIIEDWSSKTFPFLFFVITSIFISFFYYLGIRHSGRDYLLEVLFYVSFPFFFMNQLGVIKQGMATSMVFYAITLRDSKLFVRFLLLVIAYFCHQSAIIGFLIFIPFEKVSNKILWGVLALCFVSAAIVIPVIEMTVGLGFMGDLGTQKALNYLDNESYGEGGLIKYLVYLIGFLVLINYKKLIKYDNNNAYYIGLIILGVSIYALFSFNVSLGKRLGMFFFTPAVFVIPQLVKIMKIPRSVYITICIILFSLTIYVGSGNTRDEDRPGQSVTYPYRTIFEVI